jgi:hypothetical protein
VESRAGTEGVVIGPNADVGSVAAKFIQAAAQHRFWERERQE